MPAHQPVVSQRVAQHPLGATALDVPVAGADCAVGRRARTALPAAGDHRGRDRPALGELTGLSPAAVDLRLGRVYVDRTLVDLNGQLSGEPKTRGSRRVVSLSPLLVAGLTEQLTHGTTDLVFASPGGEPLRRSNFYYRTWRPAIEAADLQLAPRFHDLRHSHVAMIIAAGVPVRAIQDRLGHASVVMTMDRYGHLLQTVDATLLAAVDDGLSTVARQPASDRLPPDSDGAAPVVASALVPEA